MRKSDVKKFLTPGYSTSGHVELYTVSSKVLNKAHPFHFNIDGANVIYTFCFSYR